MTTVTPVTVFFIAAHYYKAMHLPSTTSRSFRSYAVLLACGVFGLLASFTLTYEKIHLLQHPMEAPSCSINPIITCASAMNSSQSEVFGIPLSMFGLVAYTALVTVSFLLLAGSTLRRSLWNLMLIISTLGLLGMHYLLIQSIFVLHVICPWCFGVWLTTPVIFATMLRLYTQHNPNTAPLLHVLSKYAWQGLIVWYVLLAGIIATVFWDAWEVMFSL